MALLPQFAWAGTGAQASYPVWSRSLSDLGYAAPIRSTGLEDEIALDWPLPPGTIKGGVTLVLSALTTAGFHAVLDVSINGQGIASHALSAGESRLTLSLALPSETLAEGRLRLSVRYAAAASESRCRDRRLGGVQLTIDPRSALSVRTAPPQSAAAALALLPAEIHIAIPKGPFQEEEYRALLEVAAGLARRGHWLALASEAEADLVVSREAAAARLQPWGQVILPLRDGSEPIAALRAAPDATSVPIPVDMAARQTGSETSWSFALPQLPPGKSLSALTFSLEHGADAPGIHHVVHLLINGTLASSAELPPSTAGPVTLPIPPGAQSLAGRATLTFARMANSGCVDAAAPLLVSLRASPRLLLQSAPTHARQFFDVAQSAHEGLTLYLPAAYFADPAPSLPFLAALLKDYWRPGSPLDVLRLDDAAPSPKHPFIMIAREPPKPLALPLRADAQQIHIETRDKRPVLTLTHAEDSFAMLASLGGRDGIWLAPPNDLRRAPARLRLDRGNLAVFDARGVAFWLNTEAPRGLALRYAGATGLGAIFGNSWLFGTAALWCLVSLIVLIALARRGFGR